MSEIHTPGSFPAPRKVEAIRSEKIALGRGISVQFSHCDGVFLPSWEPDVPPVKVRRKIARAYYSARNSFLTHVAKTTGEPIAMGDLDGNLFIFAPDGTISTFNPLGARSC